MPSRSDERQELAAGLRALRHDAGLSTTQLARRLGWSQAKVSRLERGVTLAKPAEVGSWARLLHAEPELRHRLVELAEEQRIELLEWKRAMAPGRRRAQEEVNAIEAAASIIWVFSMDMLPGLAQTAQYAEVMLRIGRDRTISDQEAAAAAQAQTARQAALRDRSKRFKLLCSEAALRRSLLGKAAMRAQLGQLMEIAGLPNVEMGVIPFSTRERTHTYHAFAILGDPEVDDSSMVLAESVTRTLTIRAVDEIREYISHYERLAEGALFGDDLARLLLEVSEEAPWP